MVGGGERRVGQQIGNVGLAEHAQLSADIQVVQRSAERGAEIDEHLPVGDGLRTLGSVDELEVLGRHVRVDGDAVGVGEVDGAVHCEGRCTRGINTDAVEVELTVLDADGVVNHAQLPRCGQEAVHQGLRRAAAHVDIADGYAFEARHIVGDEAVHQREGQAIQLCIHVDDAVSIVGCIGAVESGHRHTVLQEISIDEMASVCIGQIDSLQPHGTQRGLLIAQVVDAEVGGDAHGAVLLNQVGVALQEAAQTRHIRHYARQLAEVEVGDSHGKVLQRFGVGRGVDLQARAVVGQKVDVHIDVVAFRDHDIVVIIEVEAAVGQHRRQRRQVQAQGHTSLQAQVHALAPLVVKIDEIGTGHAVAVEAGIEAAVEGEMRIVATVAHASVHAHARGILIEVCLNRVQLHTRQGELVDVAAAVDADERIQIDAHADILKTIAHGRQEVMHDVAFSQLHAQINLRQAPRQRFLVDAAVLHLAVEFIHKMLQLTGQLIIAGVPSQAEAHVAAGGGGVGGVLSQISLQRHVLGAEHRVFVHQHDIVDEALDAVAVVEVGAAVHVQAHRSLDGLLHQPECLQVGTREVEAEGQMTEGFAETLREERAHIGLRNQDRVVDAEACRTLAVAQASLQGGAAQLQAVVGERLHLCLSLQAGGIAEDIRSGAVIKKLQKDGVAVPEELMAQLQTLRLQACLVGQGLTDIHLCIEVHDSAALAQVALGGEAGALHRGLAAHLHRRQQDIVQSAVGHAPHPTEVLRLHII